MKLFVIYSQSDREFANNLIKRLKNQNEITVIEPIKNKTLFEETNFIINQTDLIIVILSRTSVKSKTINEQLSIILNHEIEKREIIAIPISFEDCEIPFSLQNRVNGDFRYSFDEGFAKLVDSLTVKSSNRKKDFKKEFEEKTEKPSSIEYNEQIKYLQNAYRIGNLSIFCGAGISYDAGIPTWNGLLKSMLKETTLLKSTGILDINSKLADIFQKRINLSPLIVAQYLKNLLEDQFIETLQKVLYKDCNNESEIIKEIVELSRPRREQKPLKAVITFNFDDLIEQNLEMDKIMFKTICREGERHRNDEIPIYHPHGYVPRNDLKMASEIVFSEDAYHTQFTEPFSWSNLIQLHHLSESTCLFVGISLTDPNMRRLIDVSMRKRNFDVNTGRNDNEEIRHYIIKKRYKLDDLYFEVPDDVDKGMPRIIENIEEQDANKFGFNVIWINEFNEIPSVLRKIRN